MFVAKNLDRYINELNDFGQLAMSLQYIGKSKEDIINFIEDVVIKGNDTMKSARRDFYDQYLLPPNGKTVAENTMDVFLKAFC